MFSLEVLQSRWLILALGGGAGLVLAMILAYLALWRPRAADGSGAAGPAGPPEAAPDAVAGHETPHPPVPWFLILTFVGIAAYAVIYVIVQAVRPPNW
jgi:hypothetical protein